MSHVSPTSDLKQARATYSVRVLAVRMITPTMRAVRVEKPAEFVFRASQAARIFLPAQHDLEPHPISMASAPTRNYVEFAVRRSESAWKHCILPCAKATCSKFKDRWRDSFWTRHGPRLKDLHVPTLIVWGEHDTWISPSNAPKLNQDIAGSKLVIIPNAGHVPHEEKPEEFNGLVIDFVKGLNAK